VGPGIELTSTYVAGPPVADDPGRVYGRWSNATWEAFEEVLGALEGGSALLFASGMGAVAAVLEEVPVGGVVVAPSSAYSGTLALLDEMEHQGRLSVRRTAMGDVETLATVMDGAALVWVETPTNPLLEVVDVRAVADAARSAGALVAVDSTFATPLVQRPLDLGADVVVHAVTKLLAGHSDVVLGALATRDDALLQRLHGRRTSRGAVPRPFEAWVALRGLRTLHLRVERATENARELAGRLREAPGVTRVRYPGWGTVVSLELDGAACAEDLCAAVRLWVHATSLGGVESTLERRRRHAAEPQEVPEGLVRLSVGVEDVEDLWDDLAQALQRAKG